MNEDGTNKQAITEAYKYHHLLNWTPDGEGFYITSNYGEDPNELDIWRINLSTPNQPELIFKMEGTDYDASVSSDQTKMVFSNSKTGNFEIYEADLNTKQVTQLTNHEGMDRYPVYSPDMSQIAFVSCREGWQRAKVNDKGFPVKGSGQGDSDIWIMNADGSEQKKLTENPGSDLYLRWSSDGKYLVYCSGEASTERVTIYDLEKGKPTVLGYDRSLIELDIGAELVESRGWISAIGKLVIPDFIEKKIFHSADYFGCERFPDWFIE